MENMFKMGPKDMKGEIWDEKGRSELVEILISHQQDFINSIRFTYRSGSKVFHSQTYGESNGLNFNMAEFEYRGEVLTSVSGEYKDGRLASIVFGTNKKKYGPFGRTGKGGLTDASTSTSTLPLHINCPNTRLLVLSSVPALSHPSNDISGSYDEFNYEFKPGRFGGFHGSVDDGSVYAIGVYVKPYEVYTLDDFMESLNGDGYDDDPW